jgi:hypothetical protein
MTKSSNKTNLKTIIAAIFFMVTFFTTLTWAQTDTANTLYEKTILIELFSSEGCSSCPLADEFMEDLLYYTDSTGLPLYIIDFHVDVWNRSGWVDPFSDSLYSQRQLTYMKKKNWLSLYTPMAVLNGQEQYPGNAKKEIGKYIQKNLYEPSKHYVRMNLRPAPEKDSVIVSYQIWGKTDSLLLNVAFVQNKVSNNVTAGENKGKILRHHNVVRQFATVPVKGQTGEFKMYLNPNLILTNFRYISYLQHVRTWEVLASDQIKFSAKQ